MGAHFSIDVDELHMFAGYEWWPLGPDCDHACEHRHLKVVGWGTSVVEYELEECSECGCRAWRDGRWQLERQRSTPGDSGFWSTNMRWAVKA